MAYATADDLPPELWQIIADELVYRPSTSSPRQSAYEGRQTGITPGMLPSKYMGINRHFFHFYLDTKYGEVKWAKLDEKMLAQLDRLQCVPDTQARSYLHYNNVQEPYYRKPRS